VIAKPLHLFMLWISFKLTSSRWRPLHVHL